MNAEFLDWYPVDNHLPGVDEFSTPGKYLLYLCFVDRGVGGGDPVADQREVQALGVIGNPPNAGGASHPRFLLPAGNFAPLTVD